MLDSNGEVKEDKFDVFDIGNKISTGSQEYTECVQAMQNYYDSHHTEENRQTLNAIAALLGISISFR